MELWAHPVNKSIENFYDEARIEIVENLQNQHAFIL